MLCFVSVIEITDKKLWIPHENVGFLRVLDVCEKQDGFLSDFVETVNIRQLNLQIVMTAINDIIYNLLIAEDLIGVLNFYLFVCFISAAQTRYKEKANIAIGSCEISWFTSNRTMDVVCTLQWACTRHELRKPAVGEGFWGLLVCLPCGNGEITVFRLFLGLWFTCTMCSVCDT